MKWTETRLFRAMSSLEMNRQIVSMGLDGSLAEDDEEIDDGDAVHMTSSVAYFYRSVLWRVYLNILSLPLTTTSIERLTESWSHELYTSRAMYSNKKQLFHAVYPMFYAVDEHFSGQNMSHEGNAESRLTVFGEQLSSEGSPSASFNQQQNDPSAGKRCSLQECGPQVRDDTITLDIVRTYLVSDDDVPHNVLFNLLSVWRWQHPVIGYHQGMVELAGFCVLMLSRAARHIPDQAPLALCECANSAFLEADAYFLFDGIMSNFGLDELYHASTVVGRSEQISERRSVAPRPTMEGSGDLTSIFQSMSNAPKSPDKVSAARRRPSDATGALTTLERLCEHVVFGLLRDHSPALFHHLSHTSMFDQLLVFLPRWLRNLFTRELSVPQLVIVWDSIFAVFYHERSERAKRMSMRLSAAKGTVGPTAADVYDAIANDSSPLASVVYAGAQLTPSTAHIVTRGGTRHFSRAVAGIAVAILLNLEEDLLNLNDAFSMLQRLTATPLLSRLMEPSSLVNLGFSIARCRPPEVIPLHRRQSVLFLRQSGRDTFSASGTHNADSTTTRLTKEELLIQQRSVALVVQRVTERLHDVLHISQAATGPDGEVRLTGDEVSDARGLLRELSCVVEKLSLM